MTMVLGENGLFRRAQDAKDRTEKAEGDMALWMNDVTATLESQMAEKPKQTSGLYDLNDNMIYNWNTLLEKGFLTDTNGVLTSGCKSNVNPHENDMIGKLVIDDSITEIGNDGLNGLTKLEVIVLPDNIKLDQFALQNTGIKSVGPKGSGASVELPTCITSIDEGVFYKCEDLSKVVIGDKITKISQNAFFYCSKLSKVAMLDNVEEIGDRAFCGCSQLEIWVPDTVKSVGDWAFGGVKVVCYLGNLPTKEWCSSDIFHKFNAVGVCQICNYHKYSSDSEITLNDKNAYLIGYSKNTIEELNIPESVDFEGKKYKIVGVDDNTFSKDTKIKKATFSNSILKIGKYVLRDCSNLEEVYIPENTTNIGNGFVYNCVKLNKINISNTNSKYMDVDGICYSKDGSILIAAPIGRNYTNFKISDSVSELGQNCFVNTSIESIEIPSKITTIGAGALQQCSKLKSVNIKANVLTLPSDFCYKSSELVSVTFSNSIKTIEHGCFKECSKLTNLILPTSLEKLGYSAFQDCNSLKSIYIPQTVNSIGASAFFNTKANINFENYNNIKEVSYWSFYTCTVSDSKAKEYLISLNSEAFNRPDATMDGRDNPVYKFEI